ncbi:MAG: S1 RNA-binding domain-containing protein [Oscillatoriaceae bacterium SKW80]|nr:S1 RNA-binding domain-containing protein [Oscillatoriaceae bacterium SKYG93]MCX8119306.1 S1 RNA-binding domain-containing protein [Oscillatoriaceae bacterium SKW80]MDW8454773.1 S1 RNA-binding domain-containing protein [Oscillatoriaceae cyanobacterium SKYGB_i_bin93]HIK28446.1 30S ribosomal protein S1 [Oscillatoriaceae cyanobacterium M7585_C2015_266]
MKPKSIHPKEAKPSFSIEDFAKALEQHNYEFRKGQVVRGQVIEYVSEGAYVDIGGKSPAFLPLAEASTKPVANVAEVLPLSEERDFLIVREQNADGQVTVSLKQLQIKQIWERLAEMQESGQSLQVRVTAVNKGGVTVDVEGLRGFIPRSHLIGYDNLTDLIGQRLTANFLEIDKESNKLILSQRLASQANRMTELAIGQLVEGEIISIKPFGVFVDLNGITGLLHVKQISQNYISSLSDLFQEGQSIKAVVIDIDEWKRRISLSTRVLENYPGEILEKMAEVMADASARAQKVRKKILSSLG